MKQQKKASQPVKNATAKQSVNESKFVVKAQGYQETFTNLTDAKTQYDLLKKRTVKSQESMKIELSEIDSQGNKKILESVSISEEFFK